MHLNAEFQRIARRGKKALLSDQCKEIEENDRREFILSGQRLTKGEEGYLELEISWDTKKIQWKDLQDKQ